MNVLEQLTSLEGQLKYTQSVLAQEVLQNWEEKELKQLVKQYQSEILEIKNHIKLYKEFFNK